MTNERMADLFPALIACLKEYIGDNIEICNSLKGCGFTDDELIELDFMFDDSDMDFEDEQAEEQDGFSIEMVKRAIQIGYIDFVYRNRTTVCEIADKWFFLPDSEDGMLPEDYKEKYSIDEQAKQVFVSIKYYDDCGLSREEAEYYRWYVSNMVR